MKRRLGVGVAVVALGCVLPGQTPSATAATTTSGTVAFSGSAHLPTFPCPPPPPFGTGPCAGTFTGEWSGRLGGLAGTSPFEVAWTTHADDTSSGAVDAVFDYSELQCLGMETAVGIAAGTGTAAAGPGEVQGKWQVPGEPFAHDITGLSATFDFQWTRVGTAAVLVFSQFAVTITVSGLPDQTVARGGQAGAATFAFVPPTTGVPTCAEPIPLDGTIAGVIEVQQPA